MKEGKKERSNEIATVKTMLTLIKCVNQNLLNIQAMPLAPFVKSNIEGQSESSRRDI